MMPDAMPWAPPEVKKNSWSGLKECVFTLFQSLFPPFVVISYCVSSQDPAAADAYSLGLLLHTLFNPNHPLPPTAEPPHPPPQPSTRGSIPTSLFNVYKKLLNPNPRARLTPKAFLEIGTADGGFFASNKLVQVCAGLDNFSLASEGEKNGLLR
jgi:SCY1-like protein 1